jgi:HEAT repeat protein
MYLRARSLLPLLYEQLSDGSEEVRRNALELMLVFGSQAELLLVEGLTKDGSWAVRGECARGLARLGPHNFRALLFGLRDLDPRVRRLTAQAMLAFEGPDQVAGCFLEHTNQVPSILSNITDILSIKGWTKGLESLLRGVSVLLGGRRPPPSAGHNKENKFNNLVRK